MTKITILALATIASSAFAGQEIAAPAQKSHAVAPQEACFGETELQVDLFGSYLDNSNVLGEGYGAGLGLSYYFHRNFGITADVAMTESDVDNIWQFSAGFVARYPFEIGGVCLAPYAKVAGGIQSENGDNGFLSIGGGLEWRATSRFGVFGEANYGFVEDSRDFLNLRAGVRFVF
jgi:hypothetical protein